ncbi:hypothetical protein HanRHA438_Chr02g0056571 [Helianthus annuus]|nr:hypothetical protein HanRHA438_Chr02g0056571 [Helianthus annuus]
MPKHLSLPSFILSEILVTPNLSLNTSFLIRSNLVWPHIHLNILISATSILRACVFLMAQHSVPFNRWFKNDFKKSGLKIILKNDFNNKRFKNK